MFKKIWRPKIIIPAAIIVVAAGSWFFIFKKEKPVEYNYVAAELGEIRQEVSVTGKVEPAQSVDLAFEKSARVSEMKVEVGDRVIAGQILSSLENSDILAQMSEAYAKLDSAKAGLLQYEAALASQKAKLDELVRGTRKEEIVLAETKAQ